MSKNNLRCYFSGVNPIEQAYICIVAYFEQVDVELVTD